MSNLSLSVRVIIRGGQQFSGIHGRITEWLEETGGGQYNESVGWSVINGQTYYNNIDIRSEADLSAFLLIFGDSVFVMDRVPCEING